MGFDILTGIFWGGVFLFLGVMALWQGKFAIGIGRPRPIFTITFRGLAARVMGIAAIFSGFILLLMALLRPLSDNSGAFHIGVFLALILLGVGFILALAAHIGDRFSNKRKSVKLKTDD